MLRLFALAVSTFAALIGGLYAGARADLPPAVVTAPAIVPAAEPSPPEPPPVADEPPVVELPLGRDVPDEVAVLVDAYAEEILDEETGLRFGPLTVVRATEPFAEAPATERRRFRPSVPAAPIPRLSADPGRHVILTARGMMARNETVRGSCYRYLSEVFARAGHEGWRTRTIVHSSRREGPYANLDLIRPGDWLYIVNHPETTPMGTHSVLFVGWEDRASGYARVIEHSGWYAGPSAGQERGYDVSRTYRIVRPILPR